MEQLTLFDDRQENIPLASRVRPASPGGIRRPEASAGAGKNAPAADRKGSDLLHDLLGASGSGKTTLASIIAGRTKANFINFSAVTSGIKEISKKS